MLYFGLKFQNLGITCPENYDTTYVMIRSKTRLTFVSVFMFIYSQMVQEIGSALPSWFIQGLLGPSSRLLPLKHSRNKRLCSELLALYQACLAVKSVPLLQTAYKYV